MPKPWAWAVVRAEDRADNMMIKVFIVQLVGVELWELRRQRSMCVRGKERLFCVFASPKNLDLFVKKSSDGEC